jgi:hypothetical protein
VTISTSFSAILFFASSAVHSQIEEARDGWLHLRDLLCQCRQLAREIALAERGLAEDMTEARLAHLDALRRQWEEELGDVQAGPMGRGA